MEVSPPTIVIVEDEEAISLFWTDSLREAGFDVQVFSDANGVLEFLDDSAHAGTHIAAAKDPLLCILGKPFDTPRLLMRLEQFGVYAPSSH